MGNRIIQRDYYEIDIELQSPLNVSNGENIYTDSDVMVNGNQEYIIPGTSLAGAFQNYIYDSFEEKDVTDIFGFSNAEDGRMSPLYLSDLVLHSADGLGNAKLMTRDFVSLNESKGVDNKFDAQVIETGAKGTIRIEHVQREESGTQIEPYITQIIHGIQNGDIRFGGNKNRGFGRLKVLKIRAKSFKKTDKVLFFEFLENPKSGFGEGEDFEKWSKNHSHQKKTYFKVRVPLKITGGISIREYSALPGEPDYGHITCNSKQVIPGTSWNGALRAGAFRLLKDFGMSSDSARKWIETWFGDEEGTEQSRIVFSESIIKDNQMVSMTRNQIDRLTGGTIDSALYTEKTSFGGETVLEYLIKVKEYSNALIKLMEFVVQDLLNGYIAVGGLTAVGRGLFVKNGEIDYSEDNYAPDIGEAELLSIIKGEGTSK